MLLFRLLHLCWINGFSLQNFNQMWLKAIYPWLFRISMVLIIFSWIMPGILILYGVPWHARAWLKGIIPRISIKPWAELSKGEVFSTYFQSIFISGFIVLAIISFIINSKLAK